jgi:DNA-binding SARP family transcriptional activator/Tfp pilus assembly protein PilF
VDEVPARLRFELLGRFRAWRGAQELNLGWPKQQGVLAMLVLRPNRLVHRDDILDAIWGEQLPSDPPNAIHGYIRNLRKVLDPDRAPRKDGQILLTEGDRYRLRLEADQLDVTAFKDNLQRGRKALAADDPASAVAAFDEALHRWHGTPLEGVPGSLVDAERRHLEELRLAAIEARADALLQLQRYDEVITDLVPLIAEHPYQERLYALRMQALYHAGRRADALTLYESAYRKLHTDLDVEPGPELRQLHDDVLTDRVATQPRQRADSRPRVVPRQLPRDVNAFTGREPEMRELDGLLDTADQGPPTVLISAVSGTAGVGKTALAVHWAHQMADRFPDGALYLDLRGYDPDRPLPPGEALAGILRSLGVDGSELPESPAELASQYRTLLAGRRMLIVLDNAHAVEQIRLLLPGEPACLVLVTSRDSLVALVARHGAHRLHLDLLPTADAVALLRTLIGHRVDAEPTAATTLAEYCARLPLALRIAAELAATQPTESLTDLVAELADEHRRLGMLDASGDPRTAVRAVFSWSYGHLDPDQARMFRHLGLHPGPTIDSHAAAALIGAPHDTAQRLLSRLTRTHLIQEPSPGRFTMHDLLRAYATVLADTEDGPTDRQAALTTLLDHYLTVAAAAMDTLVPAERHRRPRVAPPDPPRPELAEPQPAQAWLDAERATLVNIVVYAAEHGWPRHASELAATLTRYLENGGHYPDAITMHTNARTAAQRASDPAGEAQALASLGVIERRLGRYQHAAEHLQEALIKYREIGEIAGEARALGNLGTVEWQAGRNEQAAQHHQQALALFRDLGDRGGQARALGNLGTVYEPLGRYDEAAAHLTQAIAAYQEIEDRYGEAAARCNIGTVLRRQRQYEQARNQLEQALAIFTETGDRAGEAATRCNLGTIHQYQGQPGQAAAQHDQGLAFYREVGDKGSEADALNDMGEALSATGHHDQAIDRHTAAAALATQIDDRYEQARAHNGLGNAYHATGDPDRARQHWQHALALFTELSMPQAAELRSRLNLPDTTPPNDMTEGGKGT